MMHQKSNISGVSLLPTVKRKSVRTSVILPEDRHVQLISLANSNDVSIAWIIRHAVIDFLDQNQNGIKLKNKAAK